MESIGIGKWKHITFHNLMYEKGEPYSPAPDLTGKNTTFQYTLLEIPENLLFDVVETLLKTNPTYRIEFLGVITGKE